MSPPLDITDVPATARSLALIVEDPDAPHGLVTHWIVFNLDPGTKTIDEDSIPDGAAEGLNVSNTTRFQGPKPPSGTHRYYFHLFALKQRLTLADGAKREELEAAIKGQVIETAELMGRYTAGSEAHLRS